MSCAQFAQALQITVHRRNAVHVAGDRLDDQAGDLVAQFGEQCLCRREVVVRQGEREVGVRLRHARRGRHAEGQRTGAGLDQKTVAMTVVAALELHNLAAAGGAAGEPDRRHGRLGAGIDHAHHLDRRDQPRDRFGHHHFGRARRTEGKTVAHRALHRLAHGRMVVTDDHRAPRADVVDVARSLHVPQICAIGASGEERFATDRLECAHRRIHAAGQQAEGTLEQFMVGRHLILRVCAGETAGRNAAPSGIRPRLRTARKCWRRNRRLPRSATRHCPA